MCVGRHRYVLYIDWRTVIQYVQLAEQIVENIGVDEQVNFINKCFAANYPRDPSKTGIQTDKYNQNMETTAQISTKLTYLREIHVHK